MLGFDEQNYPRITVSEKQIQLLEFLILNKIPLSAKSDYEQSLLAPGSLAYILDFTEAQSKGLNFDNTYELCDPEGNVFAKFQPKELWQSQKNLEAELYFSSQNLAVKGVHFIQNQKDPFYVFGDLFALDQYDYGYALKSWGFDAHSIIYYSDHMPSYEKLKKFFENHPKQKLFYLLNERVFFNASQNDHFNLEYLTYLKNSLAQFELIHVPAYFASHGLVGLQALMSEFKNNGASRSAFDLSEDHLKNLGDETLDLIASQEVLKSEMQQWPDLLQERYSTMLRRKEFPGLCLFLTGLSGAGKSTIARRLIQVLPQYSSNEMSLLDGDRVRLHLSKGLGFSKEDRSNNVRRIGFVASEIVKSGGIAICAPIAPYESDRYFNRHRIEEYGHFIEIYVSTSLELCEQRDTKGLYRKARQGLVKQFTGISDPYELPKNAELVIDTYNRSVDDCVSEIVKYLKNKALLKL